MEFSKVVDYFLVNDGDYTSEEYRIDKGRLYLRGTLIAMKTEGDILISQDITPPDSDTIIFSIAKAGRTFRRTHLGDLINPSLRIKELESSEVDKFSAIAKLFELEFTEAELNSFMVANKFRERVNAFFIAKQQEEAETKRAAELAAMDAIQRERTEKWDRGEGQNRTGLVKGADGNGLRLRLKSTTKTKRVYTSGGEYTTLGVIKRAWNFACEYWYGGKEFPSHSTYASKQLTKGGYYGSSARYAEVSKDTIKIGCQKIHRKEAERFASLMGWNREGTN